MSGFPFEKICGDTLFAAQSLISLEYSLLRNRGVPGAPMFLRSVQAANGRHEYLRLVENYRQGDKTRQRVVLHIGRKDLLAPHLDALVRLLQTDQPEPTWISREQVSAPQSWTWGPLLVARRLFDSLSLGALLDQTAKPSRHGAQPASPQRALHSSEAILP
jgi:hypothetical protein